MYFYRYDVTQFTNVLQLPFLEKFVEFTKLTRTLVQSKKHQFTPLCDYLVLTKQVLSTLYI